MGQSPTLFFLSLLASQFHSLRFRRFLLSKDLTLSFICLRLLLGQSPALCLFRSAPIALTFRSRSSSYPAGIQGLSNHVQFLLSLLNLPAGFGPLLGLQFAVLHSPFCCCNRLGRGAQTLLRPDPATLPFCSRIFISLRPIFHIPSPLLVIT